ncbi:hypothetical protein G5B30_09725 [Sphingobacterium sp. SGG-5]|uniref:hypothetical protein n=1 Tax=Sphingobacterium sp. SGG-5 TaxID=2710881 RepID=UPI0013EDAAA7|nr:hypothetical protein [Sphingobacterium sp. SGG-5]NGM62193.1 hypothetical protein [Sphingobacterium sp. SGG-5]
MIKKITGVLCLMTLSFIAFAQSDMYFMIQGGGNLGFANEGYKGAFNGYSLHFIAGKNYSDRAYLGLGLGNERLSGTYQTNDPHHADQRSFKYDRNLFPIFIDGRLPFGEFGSSSRIGLLTNVGYAPGLSVQYDKGFLFKGGFFYLYERPARADWTVSAAYGYQQLTKNNHMRKDFQHQHFNVSVGLMFK